MLVWTIPFILALATILIIRSLQSRAAKREQNSKALSANQELDNKVTAFIAEIDTHVRVFELDPELPEIVELKAGAREILEDGLMSGIRLDRLFLGWLNPYKDVIYTGEHLIIHERMFGHVLRAWSLVEFHLGKNASLDDYIDRITVDRTGTHVFSRHMHEIVHYQAGILNPHRAADPGNRVENAIEFVKHFTGLDLDWQDFWPLYWAEFSRTEDGTWQVEYGREPATAS